MSDSTASGYILATSADAYDTALDRILQQAVVGITGLPGANVRPRWQISPPTMPEPEVNWAAIGVTLFEPDHSAYERHVDDAALGYSALERDEALHVITSFYGPQALTNAMAFFDGIQISQNRDTLKANGIDLVSIADATRVPALLAMKWQMRIDVSAVMSRRTVRQFPIRTIVETSATNELDNERYVTSITITP